MIKDFLRLFMISVVIFGLSGCLILDGFKNITISMADRIKRNREEKSVPKAEKTIKNENKGYLSKNVNLPHKVKSNENELVLNTSSESNIKEKEMSKIELSAKLKELEEKLDAEKIEKDRALNELSEFKIQFQKEVFALSNQMEQEKIKNRELSEKIVSTELSAIKSKQDLSDLKAYVVMQRNIFQSSYPVFYEVQKGDSLWKIAAKKEIYDNSYKWSEIFHANKDKLEDKDLIYPGMVLNIPRYHEFLLSNFNEPSFLSDKEIKNINEDNIELKS